MEMFCAFTTLIVKVTQAHRALAVGCSQARERFLERVKARSELSLLSPSSLNFPAHRQLRLPYRPRQRYVIAQGAGNSFDALAKRGALFVPCGRCRT